MGTDTLTQMKDMLRPLRIYDVDTDNAITAELAAYACGIEKVKAPMEKLFCEGFVQTAEEIGLTQREVMLDLPASGDLQQRRSAIVERLSRVRGQWNRSLLDRAFLQYRPEMIVGEDCAGQKIVLTFLVPSTATFLQLSNMVKAIRSMMPAQLSIRSNMPAKTWNQLDAMNNSFVYLDMLDLSFENIEQS